MKRVTFSFTRTVNGVYCLLSTCRNDNGEDIFVHQVLCNLCTVHWAIQLQERLSACVIVLTLYWLKLSTQLAPHFFILCLFPFILHPPPVYVSSSNNSTPLLHYFLVIYKFSISMSPSFFYTAYPTYISLSHACLDGYHQEQPQQVSAQCWRWRDCGVHCDPRCQRPWSSPGHGSKRSCRPGE